MKLLFTYDGLLHSRHALEETARIAKEEDAEVTVLGVVPPDARGGKSGHPGLPPHAREDVDQACQRLRGQGIEAEAKVAYGSPAAEILREAESGGYDLLVMGTHGRGPLGRAVFGSVSRKVTQRAPCTVLVVGEGISERVRPRVHA